MAEEKKYRNYTAADIEKYHKGLLSPKEMHDLERAALDDPFLADALEGYGAVPVNVSADLSELEKKLEERISGAKVIPIRRSKSGFIWLRAAVAMVLVAGAGLLIYQLGSRNVHKEEVAVSKEQQAPQNNYVPGVDSVKTTVPGTVNDVAVNNKNNTGSSAVTVDHGYYKVQKTRSDKSDSTITFNATSSAIASPVMKDVPSLNEVAVAEKDRKQEKTNEPVASAQNMERRQPVYDSIGIANGALAKRRMENIRTNYFRGRVIDSNNNPLPFANITNTRDNVGTYADASGNFTLISPDSVLNVQVYSNGYVQNNNVQLKNNVSSNKVIMQEDKSLQGLVLSQKTFNANRSPEANMKFEEPEPADGWYNYDTYIVNNIKKPEDVKAKRATGDVQISFDVTKNGEPANIKIEKSLCQKCDEEAIRLIKEGPKWKRKGKKSRVTVTVPFDQ